MHARLVICHRYPGHPSWAARGGIKRCFGTMPCRPTLRVAQTMPPMTMVTTALERRRLMLIRPNYKNCELFVRVVSVFYSSFSDNYFFLLFVFCILFCPHIRPYLFIFFKCINFSMQTLTEKSNSNLILRAEV